MPKRNITKTDVENAYKVADQAKQAALFSLRRARQLKDGADKINAEYKRNQQKNKPVTFKRVK